MQTKGFYGNTALVESLLCDLSQGQLSHAIILEGRSGIGKSTLARLICAGFLCEGADRPCLMCSDCKNILASSHPDVLEYSDSSVAAVREIREQAFIAPNQSEGKVFLLRDAGSMTPQAQNALLKVLEEPPAGVHFILCCNSRNELLPTILSRCVVYTLKPVSDSEVREYLMCEFPDSDAENIDRAVELSCGNIGAAKALLTNREDGKHFALSAAIAESLSARNEWELLKAVAPLEKDKASFPAVVEDMMALTARAMEIRFGYDSDGGMFEPQAKELAEALTLNRLSAVMGILEKFKKTSAYNLNHKLNITNFCSKLMSAVCS